MATGTEMRTGKEGRTEPGWAPEVLWGKQWCLVRSAQGPGLDAELLYPLCPVLIGVLVSEGPLCSWSTLRPGVTEGGMGFGVGLLPPITCKGGGT